MHYPMNLIKIIGLPKFDPTHLEILTVDDQANVVEKTNLGESSGQNFQELIKVDDKHFATLSHDEKDVQRIMVHDENETVLEFVPHGSFKLQGLFSDENAFYSWDYGRRQLLRLGTLRMFPEWQDLDCPPLSYLKHDIKLLVGCSGGKIMYGGEQVARINGDVSKLFVTDDTLVALSSDSHGGNKSPLKTKCFDSGSFNEIEDNRFTDFNLTDIVAHDGAIFVSDNNSIRKIDGTVEVKKTIDHPKGFIQSLHPSENVMFFLTGLDGIAYTQLDRFQEGAKESIPDYFKSSEKIKILKDAGNYKSIIIL